MAKKEKKDAELTHIADTPQPKKEVVTKSLPWLGNKFIRQPDMPLELDLVLASVLHDFERENADMLQQIENNNRAKVKIISKILKLNGLTLRHGAFPTWQEKDSNILLVPVPDELA